jgi:phage gp45-like
MSVNYDLIRALRAELKDWVRQKLAANLLKYGAYSRSSSSGEHDKISGYLTQGADEQPYDFEGRRVFPFGIRSVPPSGTWGVWLGKGGGSGDGVIVGAESSRFGPSDLADGEVAIYNKVTGVVIKLGQDGSVVVVDQAGSQVKLDGSGNVAVKGGGAPGSIKLGTAVKGNVLIQTLAVDSWGVPVTQVTPTETQAG